MRRFGLLSLVPCVCASERQSVIAQAVVTMDRHGETNCLVQ